MSSNLPSIDLTGAVLGQQYTQNFPQFVTVDPKNLKTANIRYYNESGCGLSAVTNTGYEFKIPAGAWPTVEIGPRDTNITFTVSYILPNAPVSILESTYFPPGEDPTPSPPLGNSPIGITGNVTTSSITTLSNEGQVPGTQVIDMGDVTFAQLIRLFNDGHGIWSVDQSGIKHTIFSINASGKPLQIGQIGDVTEVLGTLVPDNGINTNTIRDNVTGVTQATLTTAGITILNLLNTAGGIALGTGTANVAKSGQGQSVIDCSSDVDTWINPAASGAGHVIHMSTNATERFFIDDNGAHIGAGKSYFFRLNSIGSISTFTGTGTGTYNHNNDGTPFFVVPIVTVAGSATQGYDSANATQVHVTLGAALAFKAWTYR